MFLKITIVAAGGALGSLLRFFLEKISIHKLGIAFPYGTVIVNLTGCFLAGFLAASIKDSILFHPLFKLFLFIGILGGFTTYSGFALESWTLARDGELLKALLLVAVHIFGCFAALFGGIWLSRLT